MEAIFSDDEGSFPGTLASPFEYDDDETNVMFVRSSDGSIVEIPMDAATMTSFVRNAAFMIKAHDVNPRMQELNSCSRTLTGH